VRNEDGAVLAARAASVNRKSQGNAKPSTSQNTLCIDNNHGAPKSSAQGKARARRPTCANSRRSILSRRPKSSSTMAPCPLRITSHLHPRPTHTHTAHTHTAHTTIAPPPPTLPLTPYPTPTATPPRPRAAHALYTRFAHASDKQQQHTCNPTPPPPITLPQAQSPSPYVVSPYTHSTHPPQPPRPRQPLNEAPHGTSLSIGCTQHVPQPLRQHPVGGRWAVAGWGWSHGDTGWRRGGMCVWG